MLEIRIHGRGGQGGVTLAKIIASSRFLTGHSVQAFGLYAAERSGAPVQAFCRFDTETVTDRNLIYEPDHVLVLDPTLVGDTVTAGLKPGGWIVVNTDAPPDQVAARFPAHPVAVVDATSAARDHGLGTRSVPIVNTALAGAVARVLDIPLDEMIAGMRHLGLGGGNVAACRDVYAAVRTAGPLAEQVDAAGARPEPVPRGASFIEGAGGEPPALETGSWATAQPRRQEYVPPCNHVCPAGNDVQGFLAALADDEIDGALEILLHTTPFPSVCGRVCPAPCMAECNRAELDEAVNVRQLERLAGDLGSVALVPAERRPERVAVVGSGPAGLTAAYHLALRGYGVTVYEGAPGVGGLLRTGIPEFRLPAAVLDREVDRIAGLGVQMVTDHRVDRGRLLELARSYDGVLVATGLQELRDLRLGVGGSDAVIQGIDFLDRVREGGVRLDGEQVVVVGGGNTALDAARSALRVGAASVQVVYRRTRREMPAIAEEIEEGLAEGVALHELVQPVALLSEAQADGDSGVHGLRCVRMELAEADESGRRRPVQVPDSEFQMPVTRVILALGQSADLTVFPAGVEVREGADLLGVLDHPVVAVGDLATAEGTVAAAIGSGRRAALHLHDAFTGEAGADEAAPRHRGRRGADVLRDEVIRADHLKLDRFDLAPSRHGQEADPEARTADFREIHEGLPDTAEARRCLSCGVCNGCDVCVTWCPEGVLKRVDGELVFDYAYCKGCGICVTECPRAVVFMSEL